MQIWIDAKYLGRAIRHGRGCAKIRKVDAAKIFGVTVREYNKIENGKFLLSEDIMYRLITLGFIQMRSRFFTYGESVRPLKSRSEQSQFVTGA